MEDRKNWKFVHSEATEATWKNGLRKIFDYRDLGVKDATDGDFVAHVIRHNGTDVQDKVQSWHYHECDFQYIYILNGWATFEYEGEGVKTLKKGDSVLQKPFIRHREIACSADFEVLEIVSPGDFATREISDSEAQV